MMGVTYALGDEYTDQQASNEEDNDEDDNDTGLTLGPVLTLGQLGHGVLAAGSNEVRDSGHCDGCVDFYSSVSQACPVQDDQQLSIPTASNWEVGAQARIGRVSFWVGRGPWPTVHTQGSIGACATATTSPTCASCSRRKRYRAYLLVETVLCRSDAEPWGIIEALEAVGRRGSWSADLHRTSRQR